MTADEQIDILRRLEVWIGKVSKIFEERGCGPVVIREVYWNEEEEQAAIERDRTRKQEIWTYPERRRRRWRK